jgi:essential nuclear protein 1
MMKMNQGNLEELKEEPSGVDVMDPKVIAAYKKLGTVMKTYRSGKLPKAFKIIP